MKPAMYEPTYNSRKFRDLMLYLAHLSENDPFFGAVKLCKLLYYCDFRSFAWSRTPITGASYQKQPNGPVPTLFFVERDALIDDEEAKLKSERALYYVQHRLEPIGDCSSKATSFSEDELRIIHKVQSELVGMTASQVSALSHREPGWILTDDYEVIPYESVFIASNEQADQLTAI